MAYLLDSNTFIEAKNGYYHFDVCPGFWDWILARHQAGDVFSVEKVGQELSDGTDELAAWAVGSAAGLFTVPDATTISQMKRVAEWVMRQQYDEKSRAKFFAKADPFLIAHALAHGHTAGCVSSLVQCGGGHPAGDQRTAGDNHRAEFNHPGQSHL